MLKLKGNFPDAKIMLLGVLPRGERNDPVRSTIAQINERIARLADGRLSDLDTGGAGAACGAHER